MSKNHEDDLEDDDSDLDDEPSQPSQSYNHSEGSHATGRGMGFGNMGMFQGSSNPFNDVGRGMGAGLGGGFDRFGSGMMGMRFNDHDHHQRHSSDINFEKGFLNGFDKNGGLFGPKKEEMFNKEENLEPHQTEEQRLQRLAKKLDIPQEDQITIVDWAIRGPAQIIRLVLEYILIPYKQRKYVYKTKDQWFNIDRPKLRETHPQIQLPYIEDKDKIICGTEAIIIHILHKYNRTELLGNTLEEKVKLAAAVDIYWDLLEEYYVLCYGEYDQSLNWQKARQKYINQKFKNFLNRAVITMDQKKIEDEPQFYWIDFGIAQTASILNEMEYRFKDNTSYIQKYVNKVFELPQYIVYRKSYRFHERPYNGLGAVYK